MEYMEKQMDDLITGANLQQEESNSFKLISMTDFVLEQSKELPALPKVQHMTKAYMTSYNYAKFLKQPLTLGMFVPCDDAGNVLEIKNFFGYGRDYILKTMSNEDLIKFDKYQQAKERVLFEGFYYQSNFSEKQNKLYEYVRNKHPHVFSFEQIKNSTVETLLTGYKKEFLITLTETAIKQIGL